MTATPEKARLEELAKKRKKQTNTNSRPALTKKVKDSRPKSKNNPWQTKSYTGTKRRLNLRDDKSSSEDKEEALVLSMRHNFKTNTSDDNCEEFDTDLPLQPQGEVWKCCFCGENYEDSRSGEQWVRCRCSSTAHGHPLLKNSNIGSAVYIYNEWAHVLCCDSENKMLCPNCS